MFVPKMERMFVLLLASIGAVSLFTIWGFWKIGKLPIYPKISGISNSHMRHFERQMDELPAEDEPHAILKRDTGSDRNVLKFSGGSVVLEIRRNFPGNNSNTRTSVSLKTVKDKIGDFNSNNSTKSKAKVPKKNLKFNQIDSVPDKNNNLKFNRLASDPDKAINTQSDLKHKTKFNLSSNKDSKLSYKVAKHDLTTDGALQPTRPTTLPAKQDSRSTSVEPSSPLKFLSKAKVFSRQKNIGKRKTGLKTRVVETANKNKRLKSKIRRKRSGLNLKLNL